jgi:hypothetical protein
LERLVGIPELAATYLRRDDPRHEEVERELHWMLMEEPDDAWEFIQAAIVAAQNVDDLGYIGAGPLEDLLRYWGGRFNDDLIASAKLDPRWAYATRMLRDTPGAQEAADAAEAAWPNFQGLSVAAAESLRRSRV